LPSVNQAKDGYVRSKDKMDILNEIKKDHRKIETLFSIIESTDDTQELYQCFNQLYEEISIHTEAEEKIFYPAIRDSSSDCEYLVDTSYTEHDKAKQLLEEIESFSPTSAEFKAKVRELKQAIQHHIQEEETKVFLQASKFISQEEQIQLANQFLAMKSKLQSEM
jgi:hemerythrin superfamily protein